MPKYTDLFYKRYAAGSLSSAKIIVPIIVDLLKPESVVDVGCGIGTWLSIYRKLGIHDVLGIDGDYVNQDSLLFPKSNFLALDLNQPPRLDRTFDLVQSLEVAEHLTEDRAEAFVDFLTGLGPAVLFSAAIPGQPGNYHVNTQWPDYWQSKFKARGFLTLDCIRREVWKNKEVAWWYAQNTLLFIKAEELPLNARLNAIWPDSRDLPLKLRHPKWYGVLLLKIFGLTLLAASLLFTLFN